MQHSKIVSGIDIGSSKVTTIIGQHFPTEDKFNVIAVAATPALGFRKGQIINLEQATQTLIQSVESAERMAGLQINQAHVAIASSHIQSFNSQGVVAVNSPNNEITKSDVDRVIDAAKAVTIPSGKEIIHVIPRVFTVDGQDGVIDPVGMSGIRLELESHLIVASTPAIKNIQKCFDELGVQIQSLVYSGLATAKTALTNTERELGVALIDIGGSVTTLTIYNEGSPSFSTVLPFGANNVTNDLAIGLRFSLEDAEKIKLRLNKMVESKKFEDEIDLSQFEIVSEEKRKISLTTAVNGIIKPRLEEIFTLLYTEIKNSGFENQIPAGIVLTGGGALTVNTKDICAKIIPLPLRLASPPRIGGLVDDILNPAYSSSVGLLLYGLDHQTAKSTNLRKSKISVNGLFGKIKDLIEPLLP
jgi:cell division protein FtsA